MSETKELLISFMEHIFDDLYAPENHHAEEYGSFVEQARIFYNVENDLSDLNMKDYDGETIEPDAKVKRSISSQVESVQNEKNRAISDAADILLKNFQTSYENVASKIDKYVKVLAEEKVPTSISFDSWYQTAEEFGEKSSFFYRFYPLFTKDNPNSQYVLDFFDFKTNPSFFVDVLFKSSKNNDQDTFEVLLKKAKELYETPSHFGSAYDRKNHENFVSAIRIGACHHFLDNNLNSQQKDNCKEILYTLSLKNITPSDYMFLDLLGFHRTSISSNKSSVGSTELLERFNELAQIIKPTLKDFFKDIKELSTEEKSAFDKNVEGGNFSQLSSIFNRGELKVPYQYFKILDRFLEILPQNTDQVRVSKIKAIKELFLDISLNVKIFKDDISLNAKAPKMGRL